MNSSQIISCVLSQVRGLVATGITFIALCYSFALYATAEFSQPSNEQVDVVLLMDASGSMRVTDPLRLRDEGAKLFTQFLHKGDQLGIIEFSDQAHTIRPLSDYTPGISEKEIQISVAQVGNSGIYTDINAGIKAAAAMLEQSSHAQADHLIVLLSDGKMDVATTVGSNEKITSNLFDDVIPELKAKGVKIYTLAFSDQADKDLLSKISLATEGINWFTPSADKLHQSFADLFLAVKKPQVVPLTKKGFSIDGGVEEATFYLDRDADAIVTLVSPSGKNATLLNHPEQVKWFKSDKFDIVTIRQPEAGIWQVAGIAGSEGFATVLTDLRLIADWPNLVTAGDELTLQAKLYEAKKPVVLPEIADVVTFAFQVSPTDKVAEPIIRNYLHDDGKEGDLVAKDGIFSNKISIADPGEYRLRVIAHSPTFEREQNVPFRVRPQLVVVSVDQENEHVIAAQVSPEARNPEVALIAIDKEKHTRITLPVEVDPKDSHRYIARLAKLPRAGTYETYATITLKTKKNDNGKTESKRVSFSYQPIAQSAVEVDEVVVEKKIVQPTTLPFYLVTLLINGAFGGAAMQYVKKKMGAIVVKEEIDPQKFLPPAEVINGLEALRKKLTEVEVNLSDPKFREAPKIISLGAE